MFMYCKERIEFDNAEELYYKMNGGKMNVTWAKNVWNECKKYREILCAIDKNYNLMGDIETLFNGFVDIGADSIKIIIKFLSAKRIIDAMSIAARGTQLISKLPSALQQLQSFAAKMQNKEDLINFITEKIFMIDKIMNEICMDDDIIGKIKNKDMVYKIKDTTSALSSNISEITTLINGMGEPITLEKVVNAFANYNSN